MPSRFLDYLDPEPPLEERLATAMSETCISEANQAAVRAFLETLRRKDVPTYEHSIRVGLLTRAMGRFMHLDERALLFAGLLHDVGKSLTAPETLQRTEGWTEQDAAEIERHVMDGFRLLRGRFDFTADVDVRHHQFQKRRYPAQPPEYLHAYGPGTCATIPFFARLVALADTFDANHRVNDKFGDAPTTGEVIRERMIAHNQDQAALVTALYNAGVFTTKTLTPA